MQKEVFIAIIFGSVMGLLVAFGVWRTNQAFSEQDVQSQENNSESLKSNDAESGSVNNQGASELELVIQRPNNNQAFFEDRATISGITSPNSFIAISTETVDEVIPTNENGEFEAEVNLNGGVNDVYVYAFNNSGYESELLTLLYSSSLVDVDADSENIDELIETRKELAANPFTSFFGPITDITEAEIQIQREGGIAQITFDEQTSYSNLVSDSEIAFDELAIGDYIIAMGQIDPEVEGFMRARRILVSEPYSPASRNAVVGRVSAVSRSNLELTSESEGEFLIDLASFTDYYSMDEVGELVSASRTDISEDSVIFVIYYQDEEDLIARMIYIFDN